MNPFEHDPITNLVIKKAVDLDGNNWNPNVVFNPELRLLERSILRSGWIQPIIINPSNIIIDGFHRWRLSMDSAEIQKRYGGHVPCAVMEVDDAHAMLMTVRMNRAKGAHVAVRMSQLVRRLLNEHHLAPEEIAAEMGASADEIKLLSQENVFKARNLAAYRYSKAWYPFEDGKRGKTDAV